MNPPQYFAGGATGTLTPEQAAGSVIMGSSDQVGNEIDEFVTETLRNNLLGLPMDLAAINISTRREPVKAWSSSVCPGKGTLASLRDSLESGPVTRATAVTVRGQGHAPLLMDAPTIDAIAGFLARSDGETYAHAPALSALA